MLHMSNEIKGNYIREKAKGLVAALIIRFEP